jgi:hypothetical protein
MNVFARQRAEGSHIHRAGLRSGKRPAGAEGDPDISSSFGFAAALFAAVAEKARVPADA